MLNAIYTSGMMITAAAATVLVLLSLVVTNPRAMGPFGVTGWFLLVLVALSAWLSLAFYWAGGRFQHKLTSAKRLRIAWRRGVLAGTVLTVWLGLQSLGQLTPRDIILTVILASLVEFYFRGRQ